MSPLIPTPRAVDIDITGRCNLRCPYCYFLDPDVATPRDLPTSEWLRFFEELGECKVMNLCFAGGEPFCRDDLPALLEGVRANRMRFSILSNGTLVDDERAAMVAATGRCNFVQVSIDGSCAAVHDACRGEGSFVRAVAGLRCLQARQVPVALRLTVQRANVRDLEAAARLFLEELDLPSFSTNALGYLGACRSRSSELLLTREELELAMESLTQLAKRYPGRITAAAGPLAHARQWSAMEEARSEGAAPFAQGGSLSACGCTFEKIAVRPDGAIVPCTLLPHLELGRINRDSLTAIWRDSPVLRAMRERSSKALGDFAFCEACPYVPYCTGNCPALAHSLTGEVDHPSPDGCLKRFLEDGGRLPSLD